MHPADLLDHLIQRLDSSLPDVDLVTAEEICDWPQELLDCLLAHEILVPASPATTATCDSCWEEHDEEVQVVTSSIEVKPRYYIPCPRYGRVRVNPEVLRCWHIDGAGLARAVARLLDCQDQCRELIGGRTWRLGTTHWRGNTYEALLVRGINWPNALHDLLLDNLLLHHNVTLFFTLSDLAFSPSLPVIPLSRIITLTQESLTLDLTYLDVLLTARYSRETNDPNNETSAHAYIFQKRGEYWTIAFEGTCFRLKHIQGLGYLAYLLARPNTPVPATELFALGVSWAGDALDPKQAINQGLGIADLGDAGPLLDQQAKQEYRQHLSDLDEDLREAEANHDPERVALLKEEKEFLLEHLSAAVGLGRRDRKAASAQERARSSVTHGLRRALNKLQTEDPGLTTFLRNSINTGAICEYRPDREVCWLF